MNLAHKREEGNMITLHPSTAKKKERQAMSDKFTHGYVQSSQLYRKEVYPFLSDAARHVYFELENRLNGYQKESDFVSYSQLQGNSEIEGGRIVARASVAKGLKELIELGVISVIDKSKNGNKYKIHEVSLLGQKYTKKTSSPTRLVHVVDRSSSPTRLVHVVDRSSSPTEPKLVHVVDTQKKERNFKENTHIVPDENPVDTVLKLWTPDLDSLNAWLQRSGIAKMTQSEVDGWLIEINGYYSTKLEAGLLTDTQMYTNFVKWIKRNFSSRKAAPKAQDPIDSRNVNAAWENIHPDYSNAGEPVELEDWML
ncbi:hypothetical protein K3F72_05325 [Acinetobacter baumannii]|uniref:hypothetical protein n=3 Tax=Acinetobacter baumannii TaxID=470 RepID=UPI0007D8BBB9|nr:hypothetical protein [Acinetobacter baumannii]MDC4028927.1 hypothetical protein [Acinetobacter baumannii]MDC4046529.1 hypothetical protein [Acinetobacter baumannii]MDC4062910.1 hypothetical protein [Acinetobacter baumannii]MDC4077966.1 hypothetical protein [Acinetobacter baumannii]MDC4176346.1 hypothetical protein [Acinetobacter baumannii]